MYVAKIPEYERDVAGDRVLTDSSRADFEAGCEILPACARRFSRSFERENSG